MTAYLLPLGAVLIWSINMVVNKLAAGSIGAAEIGFFRWLIAALIFTPFVLPGIWRKRHQIPAIWRQIVALSLLGMVIYQSLAYFAAHLTTATHMGIIGSLNPIMVLLIGVIFLGQRLRWSSIAGALLAVAGVSIVVSEGQLSTLLHQGINTGDLMILLAMLSYALYNILLKRWPMPGWSTAQLLYLQIIVAVVAMFPMYWFSPKTGLNAANLPLVLYAGVMASIAAPLLWMKSVAHLGPARSSMFFNLVPILTAVTAYAALNESLGIYHAIGGALTIGGLLLAELTKSAKPELNTTDSDSQSNSSTRRTQAA